MAEAFRRSPAGQAAAAELAQPAQRTPEGACACTQLPARPMALRMSAFLF
jgi:hypothetical protein